MTQSTTLQPPTILSRHRSFLIGVGISVAILFSSAHALSIATPSNHIHHENAATISLASNSVSCSHLFGYRHKRYHIVSSLLHSSTPNGSNNAMDAEISQSTFPSSSNSTPSKGGLLQSIDNIGLNLKPLALRAHERSLEYSTANTNAVNGMSQQQDQKQKSQMKSILYSLQSCTLWMSYLFYRAYRGFFVILPAVFREVFRKLEESRVVVDAFDDDDDKNDEKEYAVRGQIEEEQVPEPMKLRTRITITVLSSVLTLSYVVSGALRVLGKFVKTFTNTTSVESSLEAAAEEVVRNEDKLRRMK